MFKVGQQITVAVDTQRYLLQTFSAPAYPQGLFLPVFPPVGPCAQSDSRLVYSDRYLANLRFNFRILSVEDDL